MSDLSRLNKNNDDLVEVEQMAEELPDIDPDTSTATATASDIIARKNSVGS